VRFRTPDAVFAAVQRAVRRAVVDQSPVPSMQDDVYVGKSEEWSRAYYGLPSTPAPPPAVHRDQLDMGLELHDAGRFTQQRPAPVHPRSDEDSTAIPAGPGAPTRPRTLPILRVIGQIGAMYIVAEGPAGLYLIDQHAAHERILYEEFMAQQAAHAPVAQHTLESTTIELPAASARLIEEHLDVLAGLGFELELFGANTFRVRAVPALLADREPGDVLRGILQDLESGADPGAGTLEEKLVRRVCKAAAVKAGQSLSYEEMQGLIRQLERCESPRTCPHGRPTMLLISADDLARQFGRE
jgi:DNA mismatch repair protein MutL